MEPGRGTKTLRVLSLTRRLTVAGDENRLLSTSLAFDPDRIEHTVVVISPSSCEDEHWTGPMLDAYRAAHVDVVPLQLPLEGRANARNFLRVLPKLRSELRRRRPHVLDARLGVPTAFGLLAARLTGIPVVTSTAYYPEIWTPPFKYLIGQVALAGVDAIISDAQDTLDKFDDWRWSSRAELVLIPNGIDPPSSRLNRSEARKALGLPTGEHVRVVGQVSRIIARKGYETFLEAARILVDRDPNLHFVGVGFVAEDRSFLDHLERRRAELKLDDRVQLVSYPGPIGDVYRAIDVFAHLSTEDSSPIAIHERMSLGIPSVITSLPGNLEIVEDEVDALVVPPGDAEAAAASLWRLLEEPHTAARVSHGALVRYERDHRPATMAAAHEDLYRRLLEAKH